MGAHSIRAAGPNDAETLFAIHRESAMTAYVEIFPPDRYRFPDAEMREVWTRALRDGDTSVLIAERAGSPVGFATTSPGWLRNLFVVPAEWGSRGRRRAPRRGHCATPQRRRVDRSALGARGERARAEVLRGARLARRRRPVETGVPAPSGGAQVRAPARRGSTRTAGSHPSQTPPTQGDDLRG
jgi:hypothetical protein